MGKRLIVAEKPSVGRDIAKALNCRQSHRGYYAGQNDIVTWAVGHLAELCTPDELDERYREWKAEDLPILPDPFRLKLQRNGRKQFEIIKTLMNDPEVERIVCATDAGREGELIFRYIYQLAECHKPVDRLWISSLTYRAIKEGFEKLHPDSEYDHLYESAWCRARADWLVGMNGSRAYALANEMKGLSVGRVMSPTLAILARREEERRSFISETYYELLVDFNGFRGKLVNTEQAQSELWSRFSPDKKAQLESITPNYSRRQKP